MSIYFYTVFHADNYSSLQLAQKLYEGVKLSDVETTGLITYMRTDGFHVGLGPW